MAYMTVPKKEFDPTKKTYLLIHPQESTGALFKELALGLQAKGYQVLIPDLVGHGRSSKPQGFQYSINELTRQVASLLNWYKLKQVHVFGHGLGGLIALNLKEQVPHLIGTIRVLDLPTLSDPSYKGIDHRYLNIVKMDAQALKKRHSLKLYQGQWRAEYEQNFKVTSGLRKGPDWPLIAYQMAQIEDAIFNYISGIGHPQDLETINYLSDKGRKSILNEL